MATYEVEHDIPPATSTPPQPSHQRRPDLSTFFSALSQIDTSSTPSAPHHNPHAVPTPGDVAATFRTLADAFEVMRVEGGARARAGAGEGEGGALGGNSELLEGLIATLLGEAEAPPREVKGVGDEFLADLDRIPKSKLKPADVCPICNNPFLDDAYPLVVRLPCHKSHIFDLECITPWLKLHPTCPLDRIDLLKKPEEEKRKAREAEEREKKAKEEEEEEEEWDEMYA